MNSNTTVSEIINSIQLPQIPDYEIRLQVSSGNDIREEIQQAIAACSQQGGGKIIIPPGVFRCNGPIHLASRIELHFQEGCFLKFSPNPELYLPQVQTRWEGVELWNYSPMIYGNGLSDVAITGKGIISGGSEIRLTWKELQRETQQRVRRLEEEHIPVEKRVFGPGDHLRPALLQLMNSERILFEDFSLVDNAFWMIHPVYCKDITIRRLNLDCMLINNDGIDLDSCERVLVEDSVFRNGDDAVVIKSGRDQDGLRVGRPTRKVVIRNCVFAEVLHGFAIGSELSGGAEDIFVQNITMKKVLYEALSFKSTCGRGGVIKNIEISDITVEHAGNHLVCMDNNYQKERHGDAITLFKNITIRNLSCRYAKNAFRLFGKEELPFENINLQNVTIDKADTLYSADEYASDVHFENVSANGTKLLRNS